MIKKVLILTSVVILLTFVGAAYFLYSISRSFKKLNQGVLSSEFVTDTIPFRYSCSGHILIDVKVNEGKSFSLFILDSGASNIVFKRFSEEMSFENNGFLFLKEPPRTGS
nr:hypothetical protein [uncultured Carboxylicivirga sp.]